MDMLILQVEAKRPALEICAEHDITIEQLNKFLLRAQHTIPRSGVPRVNLIEKIEDYRHAVMTRLPELAMSLPPDVRTAEFLRKSAVDLGDIGTPKEPESSRQPLFQLPAGAMVSVNVTINKGEGNEFHGFGKTAGEDQSAADASGYERGGNYIDVAAKVLEPAV
jgi:hypothetical protein